MKKVFAVLAVVLLFSGAAFASNAELIAYGGIPVQFLNLEENAIVNPALLGNYEKLAVLGIAFPILGTGPSISGLQGTGLVILGTGPGILGIVAGPRTLNSTDNLSVVAANPGAIPNNTFNLGYAIDLKGMKVGLSAAYGIDNLSQKNQWVGAVELVGKDELYTSNTMLKLTLGAALNGGMGLEVAASVAMPKYELVTKDFDNSQNKLQNNPTATWGAFDIAIDAKAELASMLWALNVTLGSLQYQTVTWTDANLDGDAGDPGDVNNVYTETDSGLGVNLLAGKVIKATENLSIIIGSGVKVLMYGDPKVTTEDKIAGTRVINSAAADSGMAIAIPFNLAAKVALGKFVTWENTKWSLTAGISKEAAVLNTYTDKTINAPVNENIITKTDHSDLYNDTPVVGGIGAQVELGDLKAAFSLGANLYGVGSAAATTVFPNIGVNLIYAWK